MRTESFQAINPQGLHRVVYHEWGSRDNQRVLVCVHGLARNSRDFDDLAHLLSRDYRVVCPDIVGRGQSDWLPEGGRYELSQYVSDMVTLIARLNVEQVDWLGTSMGGLIGMSLAALPNTPVRRLVMNDIGPHIDAAALQRIGDYVDGAPLFESLQEVEAYLRGRYEAFQGLSDKQWRHLAQAGSRETNEGLRLHYDPAVGRAARAVGEEDIELWPLWQQVRCPQLLIWGEQSDVLTRDTVLKMRELNPALQVQSVPGAGHCPSLMVREQIHWIQDWLRQPLVRAEMNQQS